MIYGSVCSGIEAASVAWHPLGWRAAFLSEIEKFPRAVLAHHYPDVPLHGDFTTIQKGDYAAIDLLVGGTPCQSFSVAGLRKGLDDPRGNLMLEFGALARRLRPVWLVWENVPGVLSSNGGRDFGSFLGMLGELGYGFAYRVLDAVHFGVPQFRRRVFVVAHIGDWRRAAAVLFERASLSRDFAPVRGKLRGRGKDSLGCLSTKIAYDRQDLDILIYDYEQMTVRLPTIIEFERAQGFPDGYTDITEKSPFGSRKAPVEPSDTVRNNTGEIQRNADEPERSLCFVQRGVKATGGGSLPPDGQGSWDSMSLLQHQASSSRGHGLGNDGLGLSGRERIAYGPRYKALGNSMAVPVMHWIGQRIDSVDAIISSSVEAAA